MTPFRRSQVKLLIEAQLKAIAPQMAGAGSLREVFEEIHRDSALWTHLELLRRTPSCPTPSNDRMLEALDG